MKYTFNPRPMCVKPAVAWQLQQMCRDNGKFSRVPVPPEKVLCSTSSGWTGTELMNAAVKMECQPVSTPWRREMRDVDKR